MISLRDLVHSYGTVSMREQYLAVKSIGHSCFMVCRETTQQLWPKKEIGLSQKPARIGMITARQRVGLCAGPKKRFNFF